MNDNTVDLNNRTPEICEGLLKAVAMLENDFDDNFPEGVVLKDQLSWIETLDLKGLNIKELKAGDFDGLAGLRYLELDKNELDDLPEGIFNNLGSLVDLRLGHNRFEGFPKGIFDSLEKLEFLHLNDNNFLKLRVGLLDNLEKLEFLTLENNRINHIDNGVFKNLDNLLRIDLRGNEIDKFSADVFSDFNNLTPLFKSSELGVIEYAKSKLADDRSGLNPHISLLLGNDGLDCLTLERKKSLEKEKKISSFGIGD